ncbi:hypothetical protein JXA48_04650 [Candidatus Woesearchaeota archaeon]|nr:hypothetical protein [Candidatus Woesearchaeota archaeon]
MGLFTKKAKVILDTNFLLQLGKGVDIFTEIERVIVEPYELYYIDQTLIELKNIMDGKAKGRTKGADKFNAKLAFILIQQKGLKTLKSSSEYVDDAIVAIAEKGVYVATMDANLQRRVDKKGAKVLITRQNSHVVIKEKV